MRDLMGQAIQDYFFDNAPEDLQTETSISEMDILPVSYLFRSFDEMNALERKALLLSKGHVLDVGCGAGSHSLYLQNEKKLKVTSIDISPLSIEVCSERGLKNAVCTDLLDFAGKYNTILLLMNGTGIFESLQKIDLYLKKLKTLLTPEGQILIDSTDILYMYDQDDDGGYTVPAGRYYGELDYFVYYKNEAEHPGKWLYLDFNTLHNAAENNGFSVEKILEDGDFYLAKMVMSVK